MRNVASKWGLEMFNARHIRDKPPVGANWSARSHGLPVGSATVQLSLIGWSFKMAKTERAP
jgi:hypothetical protein